MVKTTYALTLFAAVSLAAPVAQLTGRAEKEGSVEHKNLIQDLPILGPILGGVCTFSLKKAEVLERKGTNSNRPTEAGAGCQAR